MLARFQQLGLANAHQEPWSIANRWTRGPATGRVFLSSDAKPGEAATSINLTMATGGWSPATEGTVKGPVVGVAVEKVEDLQQYKGKLKGAIVVLGKPLDMQAPQNPMLTPWGEETIPIAFPKSDKPFDFTAYMKLRTAELAFFAEEKAAAVLLGSEKWFGLLNMSISGRDYQARRNSHRLYRERRFYVAVAAAGFRHGASRSEHRRKFQRKARGSVQHRCRNSRQRET